MQIRSFRESGEPVWVNAPASAPVRLGPDSRSALGPAATPAALTGRTRDRTRPMLHQVRKLLPERRPHVTHCGNHLSASGPDSRWFEIAQRRDCATGARAASGTKVANRLIESLLTPESHAAH